MNDPFVTRRVASLSDAELHAYNQAINARIAGQLQLKPAAPQPLTDQLAAYAQTLGDGSRQYEGLASGMTEFDHLMGGLHKFVLLAARAGTGKSTLAVQLALGVMQTENVPVLYYSYEMPKADIITMTLQNLSRQLTRRAIVLGSNSTNDRTALQTALEAAGALLSLYVVDSASESPNLGRIEADIGYVSDKHQATPLVIIDSLQDLIEPNVNGTTTAEAVLAQRIVEIQQATGATFLTISQKAKGNNLDDPYSAVLGSVSLIHKPTAVLELIGVYDLIRKVKDGDTARTYLKLADSSAPRPVIARVIKGRHNGSGHVSLIHYGALGYFETGHIRDYDVNDETSLYAANALTN